MGTPIWVSLRVHASRSKIASVGGSSLSTHRECHAANSSLMSSPYSA